MKFKPTYPYWTLALMTASVWGVVAAGSHGQEVSSVVDGRVESGEVIDEIATHEKKRHGGLELAAVVSAAYDNNIYLSRTDPTSDMVYRIGPLIAYTQGDAKEGEGAYVRVAYAPIGVVYADEKANNRIDQSAAVTAGWKGKVSKLTYSGVVQNLGDATADTGTQTERLELQNEVRAAWMPREKVTLELAAGGWQTKYQNAELVDSGQVYGEVAMRYAYSPKTEVGIVYQAGRLKIESAPSQTIQQVTGSFVWQPREKIRVSIDAGAEFRKADSTSTSNPVLNARVDWEPLDGSRFFITAFQRQEVSALNEGQIYQVKGFAAGLSQRLGGNWTARLDGGYETASYIYDASSGASSREDRIWFVRPALNYQFTDELDGSLFFQASDNHSTDPSFGYDAASTGLELNYKF